MADEPEETPLNRKAFFALEGGSLDCVGDLINLLRSSDPIHPLVRERLAEALEGGTVGGARLMLAGHKQTNDIYRGIFSRKHRLELGEQAQSLIDAGMPRNKAVEATARNQNAGEELCNKGLDLYREACALADEWQTKPVYSQIDRRLLVFMCGDLIGRDVKTSRKKAHND